jgi:hypothetical protein
MQEAMQSQHHDNSQEVRVLQITMTARPHHDSHAYDLVLAVLVVGLPTI